MVSVAGATPERWFRITCAFALLTCAPKVRRPPPALRIWTVAVAIVRLHMSRERTTFVVLTSRMGRLFKFPIGITVSVCVSNKNGPAMNREPSCDADTRGLKPDTLRLRNTIPEATSYTKIRLFGLMPACADTPTIRLPEAAVERLAKKFAGVFTGL